MLKIHAGLSRKCVFTYAVSMCNNDIYDAGTWAVGQIKSQPCAVLENVLNQACYKKNLQGCHRPDVEPYPSHSYPGSFTPVIWWPKSASSCQVIFRHLWQTTMVRANVKRKILGD